MDLSNYRELIFIQNKLLLNEIASILFKTNEEKENFINKYNKYNFTYSKIIKNEQMVNDLNKKKNNLMKQ